MLPWAGCSPSSDTSRVNNLAPRFNPPSMHLTPRPCVPRTSCQAPAVGLPPGGVLGVPPIPGAPLPLPAAVPVSSCGAEAVLMSGPAHRRAGSSRRHCCRDPAGCGVRGVRQLPMLLGDTGGCTHHMAARTCVPGVGGT